MTTDADQRPSAARGRSGRSFATFPFKVLGWIAGALSIAHLIEDLNWVTLKGVIAEWIQAYERLVMGVSDLLFGWIPVSWIGVADSEAHALVICALLVTSLVKSVSDTHPTDAGLLSTTTAMILANVKFMSVPLVAVLLLPTILGSGFCLVFVLLGCLVPFANDSQFRRAWLLNVVGVVGIATLLVVIGSTVLG